MNTHTVEQTEDYLDQVVKVDFNQDPRVQVLDKYGVIGCGQGRMIVFKDEKDYLEYLSMSENILQYNQNQYLS